MQNLSQKLVKNSRNPKFIGEVFEFAKEIYKDQKWLKGQDLYIDHTLRMAFYLQELDIDETTIALSLLYGVADTSLPDDKKPTIGEVEKRFGKEIKELIESTAELNKIYYSFRVSGKDQFSKEKIENLRKMFFALAKDLRVILVKMASRVDGLNRLDYLSNEAKSIYATETIEIFVPVAQRLGLGEIKRRLEDSAFAYLHPKELEWLVQNTKEKYEERKQYLIKFIPKLKKILKKEHVNIVTIDYRAKSYWSTYQKLKRHQMNFEKLYDLVAIRLIVKDVSACYKALGIIHKHFKPMSGQIQDYIAKPKENGYQSIHTTVYLDEEKFSEIQIRTQTMHKEAMYGVYAHWAYKQKISLAKDSEYLRLAKELPELQKTFKIDFYENQVFAFTPKGDIIVLPKGSTPIDFAYAVHSDIGNHCESAKIDGKIVPLSHALKNGDVIEIITSKKKQPSLDWLKFVKTGFAKSHIKKILAVTFGPIISVPTFIGKKIIDIVKWPAKKEEPPTPKKKIPHIYIGGQKDIAVNFAQCCSPKAGDETKAYIAKSGPAVLHKVSCKNFQEIIKKFPEKVVSASWQEG